MDAKQLKDEITSSARVSGLSLSEYLKENFDTEGLDDIQTVVNKGLSDNRSKIDTFRNSANITRTPFEVAGLNSEGLDLLQADISEKLATKREEYSGLCLETGIHCSAQQEAALA